MELLHKLLVLLQLLPLGLLLLLRLLLLRGLQGFVGAKSNLGALRLAVADKLHVHRVSDRVGAHRQEQAVGRGYLLVADRGDDVAALDSGCLCIMEWPENIEELLPEETLKVSISVSPSGARILQWED